MPVPTFGPRIVCARCGFIGADARPNWKTGGNATGFYILLPDAATIFAPQFKASLKDACAVGHRRPDLADSTIATHRRRLDRELDRLLDLKPTDVEGSHLRATIAVTARDKLLVFLTRRDVEATNNESERALRPSVIFRKVTNGFRSEWGAKLYADLCSIVATGRLAGRSALAAIRDALAAPVPARTAA